MADSHLSQAETEQILAWLKERWVTSKECQICRHNRWSVPDDLVAPPVMTGNVMELGGKTYPAFMVVCANCGFTHYFNAVIANIRPNNPPGGQDGSSS